MPSSTRDPQLCTMTTRSFIRLHRIRLDVIDGPHPARDDYGWEHYAYRLRLKCGTRTFETPWRQGIALTNDPELESVLDALASDSLGVADDRPFEDWCADYGYDDDSRRAERMYRDCKQQATKLRDLLGNDAYEMLLWRTERL